MRLDQARALLDGVLAYAAREGLHLSAAVVDERGFDVAVARGDGASFSSPMVARVKARTAATYRRPSGELAGLRADYPEVLRIVGEQIGFAPTDLPGGVPVLIDGELLGAIGVSGGLPELDLAAAQHAVATLEETVR